MCGADTLVRDLQCPLNQHHCLESVTNEHCLCPRTVKLARQFRGQECPRHMILTSTLAFLCPEKDIKKGRFWKHDRPFYLIESITYCCSSQAVFRISDGLAGWYLPASARREMARRFHALMVATASVRFVISFSLKCRRASSYTASGTWVLATRVTASVHASAARSRSL